MKKAIVIMTAALCFAACATQGAARPPRWVGDLEAVYPRSEWLTALETGRTRREAEAAALASLAAGFRVDVAALTKTSLASVQNVQKNGAKAVSQSAAFHALTQEVSAASSVAGLIGVEKEFWNAPAGEVYALVRMNRAPCAARYAARIGENEALIEKLIQAADNRAGTLDAYANLAFAAPLAALTDGFISILSVLSPQRAAYTSGYGSAAQVTARLREAAGRITARLDVRGDKSGRLEKAFAGVFTTRGFRVGANGAVCTLRASCAIEDSPQSDGNFVYARVVINAALLDADGKEICAWSENDRQGHANLAGARERALSRAEALITETGFAAALDAALASRVYGIPR